MERTERAVYATSLARHRLTRSYIRGCGHGLRALCLCYLFRALSPLTTNNHVRTNRHRSIRGAVLYIRKRDRVPERPIPQDLYPQWSLSVFSPNNYLQGSCYCALESLVSDETIPPSGTLDQDLNRLATIVEDDVPAYVLVRLDEPPSEWLAIYYVPDSAKVRDKVRPKYHREGCLLMPHDRCCMLLPGRP